MNGAQFAMSGETAAPRLRTFGNCYKTSDLMAQTPRESNKERQSELAIRLLGRHGMMRTAELGANGIAATTLNRMLAEGTIVRLSRGLYQLAGAPYDTHHDLAEAAKRVPRGVICLTSVLAFHELTDQVPSRTWMAIGLKDWTPSDKAPRLRVLRMTDNLLRADVETHVIESVHVQMFNIPRTLVDSFRFRRSVGISVAVEALREALRRRKTTPAAVAGQARARNVWPLVSPYLEALTIDG